MGRSRALVPLFGLALAISCAKHDPLSLKNIDDHNVVESSETSARKIVGEGKAQFEVLGEDALKKGLADGTFAAIDTQAAQSFLNPFARTNTPKPAPVKNDAPKEEPKPEAIDPSLVVGFPVDLLNENQVFGGVITEVSDKESQRLGSLKLTDLPPVHVKPIVARTGEKEYSFALLGCANNCKEASAEVPLVLVPVIGVDTKKNQVLVNLAALGDKLNLLKMLDPSGMQLQLQTKSSRVVLVDYSLSTLVFDVEVKMEPLRIGINLMNLLFPPKKKDQAAEVAPAPREVAPAPAGPETTFKVRWYLKLASAFSPSFEPRAATEGVGYFTTSRSATPRIERHLKPATVQGLTGYGLVKYFIKNVPKEHQAAFASAFDEWNDKFTKLTGNKIFSYEFVEADSPKAKLLVPGDPRYNIVEWDLVNRASYGGLGPSMANQFTGEIFSSNVLIQGPHIIELYKGWFTTAKEVNALRIAGRELEAEELYHDAVIQLRAGLAEAEQAQVSLRLGDSEDLEFRVPAQLPSLHDPLMERLDFEPLPVGYTYETYMAGYFHEMLTHELGHNLGLRHNFRGNLGAEGDDPSNSIMEYLGRSFRHKSHVGSYDLMALDYGYLGKAPEKKNLFCTDENVPTAKNLKSSAECSRDDATTDPFKYFDAQLAKAVNLLLARDKADAPVWTVAEMKSDLDTAVTGLVLYAATAKDSAGTWTAFFNGGDRPNAPEGVRDYVLAKLKSHVCDPTLAKQLAAKKDDAARGKVKENFAELAKEVVSVAAPFGAVYKDVDLKCE